MLIENGANSVRKYIEDELGSFLSHVTIEKKIDFRSSGELTWVVRGVITRRDEYARNHHCATSEKGREFEITATEQARELVEEACVHNWSVGLYGDGISVRCHNCHRRYEIPNEAVIDIARRQYEPTDCLGKDKTW